MCRDPIINEWHMYRDPTINNTYIEILSLRIHVQRSYHQWHMYSCKRLVALHGHGVDTTIINWSPIFCPHFTKLVENLQVHIYLTPKIIIASYLTTKATLCIYFSSLPAYVQGVMWSVLSVCHAKWLSNNFLNTSNSWKLLI